MTLPRLAVRSATTGRKIALAVTPLLGAAALSLPAPSHAATVTCQAIDATGLLTNSIPSPNCGVLSPGDSFVIDFANVFALPANGGQLDVNAFYSLQIANLNQAALTSASFTDLKLAVKGKFNNSAFPLTPITIWSQTQPTFPLAQGLTAYATSGNSNATPPTGITGPVFDTAAITLAGPVTPSQLGSAAVVNTVPIDLVSFGVDEFTGARITGTFIGPDPTPFSAGLALFNNNPLTAMMELPFAIYGNAFNVPPTSTPGPLPLLGVGAAFSWSRRLRRRQSTRV